MGNCWFRTLSQVGMTVSFACGRSAAPAREGRRRPAVGCLGMLGLLVRSCPRWRERKVRRNGESGIRAEERLAQASRLRRRRGVTAAGQEARIRDIAPICSGLRALKKYS